MQERLYGLDTDTDNGSIKSGMDCAVVPLEKHKGLFLVQTVDFFYPLVDDPYAIAKIALANIVSDIYAVGVTEIDKLSLIITAPNEMEERERSIIMPIIASAFQEAARAAGCIAYIQSVNINPWCMIGGVASAIVKRNEIIMPYNAKDGDSLVLTKPLGTQLATNIYLYMKENSGKYLKVAEKFSDVDIEETYKMAVDSMSYLNKTAALLMHKYNANAATDVTGYGLLGHATNLVEIQKNCLQFVINKIPVFKNVLAFESLLFQESKLRTGKSVETSGGLLISMPSSCSDQFCQEFKNTTKNHQLAWVIGYVKKSHKRELVFCSDLEIFEVELPNF